MNYLSYVIKNNQDKEVVLDPGEAYMFAYWVEGEEEAWSLISKAMAQADLWGHTVMNVYLNELPWDAREWYTEGCNSHNYPYDDDVVISKFIGDKK